MRYCRAAVSPVNTGAANFKVTHSQFKAGAQFGEFFNRFQTFFRRFTEHFIGTIQEVRIGTTTGTTYTPPHLI